MRPASEPVQPYRRDDGAEAGGVLRELYARNDGAGASEWGGCIHLVGVLAEHHERDSRREGSGVLMGPYGRARGAGPRGP